MRGGRDRQADRQRQEGRGRGRERRKKGREEESGGGKRSETNRTHTHTQRIIFDATDIPPPHPSEFIEFKCLHTVTFQSASSPAFWIVNMAFSISTMEVI